MRFLPLTNFEILKYYWNGPKFDSLYILLHWFIDFMLKGKRLLDYANSFSHKGYGKNDKIILNFFQ